MKFRSVAPIRVAKVGYILVSAAFILFGLACVLFPEALSVFLGRVLGVALILFGAFRLVGYFSRDLYRLAFQFDLEFGLLSLFLGLAVLLRPAAALILIGALFGACVLVDGLFKIRISLDARAFGIRSWWILTVFAALAVLAGLAALVHPFDGAAAVTVLAGIGLVCDGLMNLGVALDTVKIVKNQHPDVFEGEE